jgi:hypothetical protein
MHSGERHEWRALSKCAALTTEEADALFFPPPGGKKNRAETFCQDCPVLRECLSTALPKGTSGFWAGTTEQDRQGMRDFVQSVIPMPLPISEVMPKEPTRRSRRLRVVPDSSHPVGLDAISGPTFIEELQMLG